MLVDDFITEGKAAGDPPVVEERPLQGDKRLGPLALIGVGIFEAAVQVAEQVLVVAQKSRLAETQLAALLDQRSGGARAQVLVLAHQVAVLPEELQAGTDVGRDRKSTRLNSSP